MNSNYKPKVSVIMLTYNRESMVAKTIRCILNQTFTDFEFIIVNNGSSDNSGKIADEYSAKDARIRVIHKERGNIGSGRNVGLEIARGDYIAFIDDDDICEPDFLEFLYNLIAQNSADIAICGTSSKNFDEKIIMSTEQALIELMWRKYFTAGLPAKMFSKNIISDFTFSTSDKFDDLATIYKFISSAKTIAYHGLPKYIVCRHENNHSAWTTNHSLLTLETLDEYLSAYRERTVWLCERFSNSKKTFLYFEWSFMISMVEKISRLELVDCYERKNELIEVLRKNKKEFLGSEHILEFERAWFLNLVEKC